MSDYILSHTGEEVDNAITKISDLNTDSLAKKSELPTKTSELQNDSQYINETTLEYNVGILNTSIGTKANKNIQVNELASTGIIDLVDNSVNKITPTGNITFTLPQVTQNELFHQILIQMKYNQEVTIDFGTTHYFGSEQPLVTLGNTYDVVYEYDNINSNWVVGIILKG